MSTDFDFISGDEKNNMNRVTGFFVASHDVTRLEDKCKYFGNALGCLWAIYENRSWRERHSFFKSSKSGLGPTVKTIQNFVYSKPGFCGDKWLDLLKVLVKSVLRGEKQNWKEKKSNGVLGKKEVYEAIQDLKKELPVNNLGQSHNSWDYPTKEEVTLYSNMKKTVWGFLKDEIKSESGQKFVDNLMDQTSELLLDQVKKGIIEEYTSIIPMTGRWFKSREIKQLNKIKNKLKTTNEELNEKNTFDIDIYLENKTKLVNDATEVVQDYTKKRSDNEGKKQNGDIIIPVDSDAEFQWFKEKINNVVKNLEMYFKINKALSDSGKKRSVILGQIAGLISIQEGWKNDKNVSETSISKCIEYLNNFKDRYVKKIIELINPSECLEVPAIIQWLNLSPIKSFHEHKMIVSQFD